MPSHCFRLLIVSFIWHDCFLFQFFETVVRYDRFFSGQAQHIPTVLVRVFQLILLKQKTFIHRLTLPMWRHSGLMVSVLERSRFEPWLGTLCCVLGQDTLLSQCLSLPTEHDELLVSNFQQQRKICFKYNVHAWLITENGMLVHVHYRISCQKLGQDASTIYHLYIFFYSDLIYSYHYNFVSS